MSVENGNELRVNTLYQPETLADPYPFYRRLRQEDPVHWDAEWQSWFLSSHSAALFASRDPRFSARRVGEPGDWVPEAARSLMSEDSRRQRELILFLDAPQHSVLRSIMVKAFTPRLVERLRERIELLVGGIIDRARESGRMEVMAELAYPLPATVIAELLGVPLADRDRFVAWSSDYATRFDGTPGEPERYIQAVAGVMALNGYMADLAAERRKSPREDLLSALLIANEERRLVATEVLTDNMALLLFAGHETTTNLIGNGLLALLRHPAELARLREDPTLIASAVEELLRYDSPVQLTGRLALEDVEIDGRQIAAGQFVNISIGAANRDPAQFSDPDQLDLSRQDNKHLAFLQGPHYCLGAALARLEGQIVLGALARLLDLHLETEDLPWRQNLVFHGMTALPVAFS